MSLPEELYAIGCRLRSGAWFDRRAEAAELAGTLHLRLQ